MPIKSIARQLGNGRNTVRGALASDGPPMYQRLTKGSIVDAVEPQIRQLMAQWPTVPTTVTAERISWTRSLTVLKDRVTGVTVVVSPTGVADRLSAWRVGPVRPVVPAGGHPTRAGQLSRPPVLVMVIPSRRSSDLLARNRATPSSSNQAMPACHVRG